MANKFKMLLEETDTCLQLCKDHDLHTLAEIKAFKKGLDVVDNKKLSDVLIEVINRIKEQTADMPPEDKVLTIDKEKLKGYSLQDCNSAFIEDSGELRVKGDFILALLNSFLISK